MSWSLFSEAQLPHHPKKRVQERARIPTRLLFPLSCYRGLRKQADKMFSHFSLMPPHQEGGPGWSHHDYGKQGPLEIHRRLRCLRDGIGLRWHSAHHSFRVYPFVPISTLKILKSHALALKFFNFFREDKVFLSHWKLLPCECHIMVIICIAFRSSISQILGFI